MRAVFFMSAQSYLGAVNVVYSLHIFRTPPNFRAMSLYLKHNVYFAIQSQQDVLYP